MRLQRDRRLDRGIGWPQRMRRGKATSRAVPCVKSSHPLLGCSSVVLGLVSWDYKRAMGRSERSDRAIGPGVFRDRKRGPSEHESDLPLFWHRDVRMAVDPDGRSTL